MSHFTVATADKLTGAQPDKDVLATASTAPGNQSKNIGLGAKITKSASHQTYYTIRFLVDADRIQDAYRAYAYFRWLDDWLDKESSVDADRQAFVSRQLAILEFGYQRPRFDDMPLHLTAEERMLLELVDSDQEPDSGLQSYIRHMMAVMIFDANRRGRLVSESELAKYSSDLAIAVTEALHYFIGHGTHLQSTESRYLAATAAHITHMLRDTYEDTAAAYYNVPAERLTASHIQPSDIYSEAYRLWVKDRVALARAYFKAGREYLRRIENFRCRLAGYAYIARFEHVLDTIERDEYRLRVDYHDGYKLKTALRIGWSTIRYQFRNVPKKEPSRS